MHLMLQLSKHSDLISLNFVQNCTYRNVEYQRSSWRDPVDFPPPQMPVLQVMEKRRAREEEVELKFEREHLQIQREREREIETDKKKETKREIYRENYFCCYQDIKMGSDSI